MKLIIIGNVFQPTRQIEVQKHWLWFCLGLALVFFISLVICVVLVFDRGNKLNTLKQKVSTIESDILYDRNRLNTYEIYNEAFFTEQSKQAGILESRITRIEAYGQKIASDAGFSEEFDFNSQPAIGGPEDTAFLEGGSHPSITHENLNDMLSRLDKTLSLREKEIGALSSLLQDTELSKERSLTGRPIEQGWLSSRYGQRRDPFHGRPAFHKGIDFAGKLDSNILSVASGVVTYSGERYGYGTMVEINHANGYLTRYAHNRENKVKVGDVVSKGQIIAKMGTSGRSTGPHVHFEVLKNGRHVDPNRYIYRKAM